MDAEKLIQEYKAANVVLARNDYSEAGMTAYQNALVSGWFAEEALRRLGCSEAQLQTLRNEAVTGG